jgi:hypothetical protein
MTFYEVNFHCVLGSRATTFQTYLIETTVGCITYWTARFFLVGIRCDACTAPPPIVRRVCAESLTTLTHSSPTSLANFIGETPSPLNWQSLGTPLSGRKSVECMCSLNPGVVCPVHVCLCGCDKGSANCKWRERHMKYLVEAADSGDDVPQGITLYTDLCERANLETPDSPRERSVLNITVHQISRNSRVGWHIARRQGRGIRSMVFGWCGRRAYEGEVGAGG